MKALAKAGFTQSYTYFTWRNASEEIEEYLTEITQPPVGEYFRGNLFAEHAGHPAGGPAARRPAGVHHAPGAGRHACLGLRHLQRLRAAARTRRLRRAPRTTSTRRCTSTRSGTGIGPATSSTSSRASIRSGARTRRSSSTRTCASIGADEPSVLFYGKATPDGSNVILVALNLDPFETHYGRCVPAAGRAWHSRRRDLRGRGPAQRRAATPGTVRHNWVRLDPKVWPAHILRVRRRITTGYRGDAHP